MADPVTYKYLAAPLTRAQLDALVQIPERDPQGNWQAVDLPHIIPILGRGAELDAGARGPYGPRQISTRHSREPRGPRLPMKVRNSLKSLRGRHRDNRLVRRKGRVYVINKTQRRFKARQG